MAKKTIKRSNGQEVVLLLHTVDRQKCQVVIDVPDYNSRFTFSKVTGKIMLISDGRQKLDENKPTIAHVSQSVYNGMAGWAGSILKPKR